MVEKGKAAGPDTVLSEAGYDTSVSSSMDDAQTWLDNEAPALIVLALEFRADQLQAWANWLRQIREVRDIPALAVFARDTLDLRYIPRSLDDFILEPYHPEELLFRAERLVAPPVRPGRNAIIFGDLVIDAEQYSVTVAGRIIYLTFKEFELIKFLASHPGKVFNREALLNEVWGYDFFGGGRTVDVHIRHLRSKLEDKDHSFINTVRNIGYRFGS